MQQLILACREEAKKKPAAVQVASGTDRLSGRGKLTRTSSDSHIKNQVLSKMPSVPPDPAKDKLDSSKDAQRKVPTLMVGAPTLISVSGNDATQPRLEAVRRSVMVANTTHTHTHMFTSHIRSH